MSATATPERLVPQLEAWLARGNKHSVYAVLHEGEWTGAPELDVAGHRVTIRSCASELAVREALAAHSGEEQPLVLLTPVTDLGDDVLSRLSRRRVARLHVGDAVRHLFGHVQGLDARLTGERWLLDALVESAPPGGYERTGAQQLGLDRAWEALLRHRYGIDPAAGLGGLITWATSGGGAELASASHTEREALRDRLASTVVGSAPLLALVFRGHGQRAQGFGLAARAVAQAPDDSGTMARTQMLLGERASNQQLLALADRCEALTRAQLEEAHPAGTDALAEGERLLDELDAHAFAEHSGVLTAGLRARQVALGRVLRDARPVVEVRTAADAVADHAQAEPYGAGHSALLALRLYRWLATDEVEPTDIRAAALLYATDSAYADRARLGLRAGGAAPELEVALRLLIEQGDERRRREEQRFAQLLAQWATNAQTHAALLGVEDVLAEIAAPIASQQPILFLLLDGMSHRVAAELLESLSQLGWTEFRRADHPERALAISTLPSATQFSRASLFEGSPTKGKAADEAKSFAAHPELATGSGPPPRLFHKGAIPDEHSGLGTDLRDEIASPRRVVGAVVNAIDDHLARSEQLATSWSVLDIAPLMPLLEAARDAGRVLVVASDHGHVIEHGSRLESSGGGGGERWRVGDTAGDGEVLADGPRVLAPGSRCVLAWDERVRYGPKKNGYHGGASAQEVLTPALVLSPDPALDLEGWIEASLDRPAWWMGDPVAQPRPPAPTSTPTPTTGQLSLEDVVPPPDWIAALMGSDLLAQQRAAASRTRVDDDRIVLVLGLLDANGGRLLRDALAQASGIAPTRLIGVLATLQAILNVDGYPVLEVDEATGDVRLDRELLIRQFELSGQRPVEG